jgi:hypothetical protein
MTLLIDASEIGGSGLSLLKFREKRTTVSSEKACKFTQIYVNYSSGKFTSIVNDLPFNLHSRLNGVPRFIYCSRYEKNFYILYLHINYLKPAGIFCSKFQIYIIYRRNQIYVKNDSFT